MLYKEKCVGCGRCKNVDRNDTDFICYHDAREICGEEYSVDEIFEKSYAINVFMKLLVAE